MLRVFFCFPIFFSFLFYPLLLSSIVFPLSVLSVCFILNPYWTADWTPVISIALAPSFLDLAMISIGAIGILFGLLRYFSRARRVESIVQSLLEKKSCPDIIYQAIEICRSINSIRSLLARSRRFRETDEGRRKLWRNARNVEYTWSPAIDAANIEDRRVNRKKAAGTEERRGRRACGESRNSSRLVETISRAGLPLEKRWTKKAGLLTEIPGSVGRGNRVRWKYDRESSAGQGGGRGRARRSADVVGVSPGVGGKCRL